MACLLMSSCRRSYCREGSQVVLRTGSNQKVLANYQRIAVRRDRLRRYFFPSRRGCQTNLEITLNASGIKTTLSVDY